MSSHVDRSIYVPPGYEAQRLEIRRRKNALLRHPDPMDPDHPEDTWEDLEAMERELENSVG